MEEHTSVHAARMPLMDRESEARFEARLRYLRVAQWTSHYIAYASLARLVREAPERCLQALEDQMRGVETFFRSQMDALAMRQRLVAVTPEPQMRAALEAVAAHAQLVEQFGRVNTEAVQRLVESLDDALSPADGETPASRAVEALRCTFTARAEVAAVESWVLKHYAARCCGGDRVAAKEQLSRPMRPPEDAKGWMGFWLGMSVALAVVLGFQLATMDIMRYAVWPLAHLCFRACFLVAFYLFTIGVAMSAWSAIPINWAFIFGIDRSRHIEPRHIFLVAGQLSTLSLGVANLFAFHLQLEQTAGDDAAKYWMLALVVLHFAFLFNPFHFANRSARFWFLGVVGRILTNTAVVVCFFVSDCWTQPVTSPSLCMTRLVYYRPVVAALPFLLRFAQCMRRFYDYRLPRDVINGTKYASSVLTVLFAGLHSGLDAPDDWTWKSVLVVASIASTVFGWVWDVLMDSGIGRPKWRFLRRHLLLPRWVYYLFIAVDLVLRCAWLFTVTPAIFEQQRDIVALAFVLAAVEIVRRSYWNVLRLANEHTQNALHHRVVDDVDVLVMDTYEGTDNVRKSANAHSVQLDDSVAMLLGGADSVADERLTTDDEWH